MSSGPLHNCANCGTSLNIHDPLNEGYCWHCERDLTTEVKPQPKMNRKERRAAKAIARQALKGARS